MTPTIEVLVQSHLKVAREEVNLNRYRVAAAASQQLLQETPVHSIPLPMLPRELARLTGAEPPTYRRCYGLALDGRLPTELVNGRHRVNRDDLPAIARMLGMPAPKPPAVAQK